MLSFIQALLSYGTAPTLVVLAVLVGWIIKKLSDNDAKGTARDEAQRKQYNALRDFVVEQITCQIKELEDRINKRIETSQEYVDELRRRVDIVERDFVQREEFYREFSGWRGEIDKVSNKNDQMMVLLTQINKEANVDQLNRKFDRLIEVLIQQKDGRS